MVISSPIFLFLYLPAVLALYWLLGKKWRNLFLVFASAVYYVFGDVQNVILFFSIIIMNYIFGIYMARFRTTTLANIVLWSAVGINLLVLAFFKYDRIIVSALNMILAPANLSLPPVTWHPVPLGISFITFTAISYIIDVYREEAEPQRNLTDFTLFLSLFPKISAGPIVRYGEISGEISDRKPDLEQFTYGIKRFVIGLGKKVLIANTLANTADPIFGIPGTELTTGVAWLGILTYTLQIYFDFSGYTDMAIGLGNMFGFKFVENFNYPYISKSLTEFWRRWHITLSTWLRDYLFIPLSHALMTERIRHKISIGKYRTNYRAMFSIVTVFTLCGLWHGAGKKYLVWGMLHGIVIAAEYTWLTKKMKKWWVPLQHAYFLLVIMLTWIFFRCDTPADALGYLKAALGFPETTIPYHTIFMYLNPSMILALSGGVLASLPISAEMKKWMKTERFPGLAPTIEVIGLTIIIAMSVISIASSTFQPFIYQQF